MTRSFKKLSLLIAIVATTGLTACSDLTAPKHAPLRSGYDAPNGSLQAPIVPQAPVIPRGTRTPVDSTKVNSGINVWA